MRKIDNLTKYMELKGLNDNRVTIECGLSQGLLNQARSGKSDLGSKTIEKILITYQDLSRTFLLTGEGSMLKPQSTAINQTNVHGNNTIQQGNIYGIPYDNQTCEDVDDAHCLDCGSSNVCYSCPEPLGAPVLPVSLNNAPELDLLDYVQHNKTVEQSNIHVGGVTIDMFMFVRDSALEPRYCPGDLVALKAYPQGEENPIPGKIYAVDTKSNGMCLRILRNDDDRLNEGDYVARSFNPDKYPDYIIRKKDIIRIFKKVFTVKF